MRVIHIPIGTAVVSTETRSQHQNRQIAMNRLGNILAEMNKRARRKKSGVGKAHQAGEGKSRKSL